MNRRLGAVFFVLVALIGATMPARAALQLTSYTQYRTGDDQFYSGGDPGFGSSDSAFGTDTVLLEYAGSGPLGGTFTYKGSAAAAAGSLKASASIGLDGYGVGSYYMVDGQPFDYLPIAGNSIASSSDQTIITGPEASYSVQFTYRMTGSALRPAEPFYYTFLPAVAAGSLFSDPLSGSIIGSGSHVFYPPDVVDSLLSWTIAGVPSNTTLRLGQYLLVILYAADSMYYQGGTCEDGLEIYCSTGLVGEGPYSLDLAADFGHTLELEQVLLLDGTGGIAQGASLRSLNGVQYPGQSVPAPAPGVLGLLLVALGTTGWMRRGRSHQPR